MARVAVGDRVVIAAVGHPWEGYSGVVESAFERSRDGLDWKVRLDNGEGLAGVKDNGLRRVEVPA